MARDESILRVAELRRACSLLLDAVETRFGGQIDVREQGVDLYWNVDLRAALEMAEDPERHLDCGQCSDDVAELNGVLNRDASEAVPLWHDLQHLAGVLRLLAYLDLPNVRPDVTGGVDGVAS